MLDPQPHFNENMQSDQAPTHELSYLLLLETSLTQSWAEEGR